jgi:ribosomal protein L6P/L9E
VSGNSANTLGFFTELELIGLGFRVRKITDTVYRFFWGHANYVYLFVPAGVFVEYSADERLIFFFGITASRVFGVASYLMLLKKLSSYRVTGFIRPGKIIRLNSGKQR